MLAAFWDPSNLTRMHANLEAASSTKNSERRFAEAPPQLKPITR